ncbi:Transglutaminase-like superfamily protein [Actinomadura rubteroloni]|uniref:Transglutaminase-like superfamily protein n=1 Tax=Actinomadura rubteroloni TaxID=1926885 RepID=A0A2P4UE02_9ACTN|nr:DUF3488 and transglutaminase-like domain-containing protein [Actinomadura rubteroloni]POM23294.1 Transglutaminase-like superfamily protein [Actinomadura rubteroloni]
MTRRYVALPVTAALACAAGLAFHRVFGYGPVLPVVAVAAVVPTLLAALLAGRADRPWPLWTSLVLSVAAWAGTAAVTVLRPVAGAFPDAVADALLSAWKSILTTLPPVPADPRSLAFVSALTWLGAAGAAELALRTPWRIAPGLPPLAVFAVALLLGVGGPGSNAVLVASVAVLLAALVLVRSPDAGVRRALTGVPVAAALGGAAFLLVPHVPVGAEPYDPREQVQAPPPQTRDGVSPLDRVGGWLLSDEVLFTVRASRAADQRLVALDRFDGVTWTSTARFVPTGGRVPGTGGDVARRPLDQTVTIAGLPGIWAPAADRPRRLDGLDAVVDPGAGVLAAARPLRRGLTYRVESATPRWDPDELLYADTADDPEARAARALPWGPGETREPVQLVDFRKFAEAATDGSSGPFQQAARLAERLAATARYDVSAPPGHGYRQLDYFLGTSRRGTSEQFATLFAVLGRTIGLPTRVVVGFRPAAPLGGITEVRSRDVLVWPEVKFAGAGWVPFDPTPAKRGKSKRADVAAGESKKLEQAQKDAAARPGDGAGTPPSAAPVPRPAARSGHGAPPWPVLAGALAAALVVGYLAAVLAAPVLRRRRRRAGTPAERVAGAWRQALDAVAALGLRSARTLTAHEVAAFGAERAGDAASGDLRPLADLANRARFAASPVTAADADRAWTHADRIARLAAARTRFARRLHPRELRRDRQRAVRAPRTHTGDDQDTSAAFPWLTRRRAPTRKQ